MNGICARAMAGIVVAASVAGWTLAYAETPITAVPPAALRATTAKSATAALILLAAAPATRVALPEPTAAERASLRLRNASGARTGGKTSTLKGLAVAFPREVPPESQTLRLDTLAWQSLADGGRAAKVDVASPGASALRVALSITPASTGVALRFVGNGAHAQPFGPVAARVIASDAARFGGYWSPVLDGDVATLELSVAAGVDVNATTLTLLRVSHQVVSTASLTKLDAKNVQDIGLAGPCNVDVACVNPRTPAFLDSTKAVAAEEMTKEDGFTYLCTGTLLNDSLSSNTPYFFSAAHCIDSALAASTLNTFWFFEAASCGSGGVPPFIQQASGAALLARSDDWDWALVRLNVPPPSGSHFSAWRAEPVATATTVSIIHHPQGDLKKWSEGVTHGDDAFEDGTSFTAVVYTRGTTEPGSSGAGLLTLLASAGYYEVRGGLWSGDASCSNPTGSDDYSRLDNMLPLTRQYLTPNAPGPADQQVAIEFYNRSLDHFFITTSAAEAADLDSGVHAGWERTGLRFLAYSSPVAGANPVCRYYRTPGFGNSHF
ncbi:MAG: serine protease, partial [Betaproteobacteria bacterium]